MSLQQWEALSGENFIQSKVPITSTLPKDQCNPMNDLLRLLQGSGTCSWKMAFTLVSLNRPKKLMLLADFFVRLGGFIQCCATRNHKLSLLEILALQRHISIS